MPIYEYRCEGCGHKLDALQKVSDAPLTDCPECSEAKLKRLISAPAFRLKGGGWYETDFKSEKERKRNLAESPSGDGKDKGDGKSSGEKPAEKSASGDSSKSAEGGGKSASAKGSDPKKGTDSKKASSGSGTEAA